MSSSVGGGTCETKAELVSVLLLRRRYPYRDLLAFDGDRPTGSKREHAIVRENSPPSQPVDGASVQVEVGVLNVLRIFDGQYACWEGPHSQGRRTGWSPRSCAILKPMPANAQNEPVASKSRQSCLIDPALRVFVGLPSLFKPNS
jgi:hypothetical protein